MASGAGFVIRPCIFDEPQRMGQRLKTADVQLIRDKVKMNLAFASTVNGFRCRAIEKKDGVSVIHHKSVNVNRKKVLLAL